MRPRPLYVDKGGDIGIQRKFLVRTTWLIVGALLAGCLALALSIGRPPAHHAHTTPAPPKHLGLTIHGLPKSLSLGQVYSVRVSGNSLRYETEARAFAADDIGVRALAGVSDRFLVTANERGHTSLVVQIFDGRIRVGEATWRGAVR